MYGLQKAMSVSIGYTYFSNLYFKELLASRKTELKITEEIIQEKDGEKDNLEKRIEASRRRESYVEKKIIEKVMFEKPPKKK